MHIRVASYMQPKINCCIAAFFLLQIKGSYYAGNNDANYMYSYSYATINDVSSFMMNSMQSRSKTKVWTGLR